MKKIVIASLIISSVFAQGMNGRLQRAQKAQQMQQGIIQGNNIQNFNSNARNDSINEGILQNVQVSCPSGANFSLKDRSCICSRNNKAPVNGSCAEPVVVKKIADDPEDGIKTIERPKDVRVIAPIDPVVVKTATQRGCEDSSGTWSNNSCSCPAGKAWNAFSKSCLTIIVNPLKPTTPVVVNPTPAPVSQYGGGGGGGGKEAVVSEKIEEKMK